MNIRVIWYAQCIRNSMWKNQDWELIEMVDLKTNIKSSAIIVDSIVQYNWIYIIWVEIADGILPGRVQGVDLLTLFSHVFLFAFSIKV